MVDYEHDIQVAIAGAESPAVSTSNVLTLANGVQLKRKSFNVLLIQRVMDKIKFPEPPMYWDKERNREVKNPDHPDYIRQCEEVQLAKSMAAIDAMIAFGTELVFCPENVEPIDSDEWIEDLRIMQGIEVLKDHRKTRYLAWITYVAITDVTDVERLTELVQSSAGTPGVKVAQAIDSFPNNTKRQ